jgi:hypothetical protein
MADFSTGGAFHKAHRTIIRAVEPSSPRAFTSTVDANGFITPPALGEAEYYVDMQGISQMSIQVNDNNQDIRVLADSGWTDGVVISSSITVSVTSYFMRDLQYVEGWAPGVRANVPSMPAYANGAIACYLPDRTSGAWERGFSLIAKARYEKDIGRIVHDPKIRNNRIYIEILKEIGHADGTPNSDLIYDFLGFEAVVSNYSENENADGLTEVSYDLISVGTPSVGKYTEGNEAPKFVDVWTYSDFRDAITKESICRFGPDYTAIVANTTPSAGVLNARYNNVTGQLWMQLSGVSHIGVGRIVRLYALTFSYFQDDAYNSDYFPMPGATTDFQVLEVKDRDVRSYGVQNATYNNVTGVATLTLESTATISVGDYIGVRDLKFSRLVNGQPLVDLLPEETAHSMVQVLSLSGQTITVNLGSRPDTYTYAGEGRIELGPLMRVNFGTSTSERYYINGGSVTVVGPLELNGVLTNATGATLSYNNADVKPRSSSVYAIA